MHPSYDKIRPDLGLHESRLCVQPTCRFASRTARDHRAEFVARDRKLGHRDHAAVRKAFQSGVSNKQLRGVIEMVGQATLAHLDLAVHATVSGKASNSTMPASYCRSIGRLPKVLDQRAGRARDGTVATDRSTPPARPLRVSLAFEC